MRGTRLSGGFYACEGVDTSLMTAWYRLRKFSGYKRKSTAQSADFGLDKRVGQRGLFSDGEIWLGAEPESSCAIVRRNRRLLENRKR